MKKFRKFLSFFTALVMVLSGIQLHSFSLIASAASTDDLSYSVENGKITITKCSTSASGTLVIPETIDGYPVTAVGEKAFSSCNVLTEVDMPDTIV